MPVCILFIFSTINVLPPYERYPFQCSLYKKMHTTFQNFKCGNNKKGKKQCYSMTRFWNNLHQILSNPKYLKAKLFKCLWEHKNQRPLTE